MLKSLIEALSMYSRIPMPDIEWDKNSMGWAICFFPVVGVIIGAVEYILYFITTTLDMEFLKICLMAAVPIIITGGIHADGFMDTVDAISSRVSAEKKLEIMNDPHTGAFAVIYFILYMIVYLGLLGELRRKAVGAFCFSFIISRALSGIFVNVFPKAKNEGLAKIWSAMTEDRAIIVLGVEALVCIIIMLFLCPFAAILTLLVSAIVSLYHYINCTKNFGGITGDLAGYFLQLEEIAILFCCVLGGRI
ncbi:adenosylcobinamide-GDP ribazoletransferase [Clostridiales bacterium]|nr:adenosylcobinamide-GDP ribazoletransferase [Clostridiales bacterium]